MRKLRRLPIWVTLLLTTGLAALVGCSKKDDAGAARATTVGCKRLCDKTFGTCVDEVLLASGKMDAKKLALFKKLRIYKKKVVQVGYDECIKPCRQNKGRFRNAKAVNDCLAIGDCKKFAACITKHIK